MILQTLLHCEICLPYREEELPYKLRQILAEHLLLKGVVLHNNNDENHSNVCKKLNTYPILHV